MTEDVSFKYYVIKLEKPPNESLGTYLCVPKSWTKKAADHRKEMNIRDRKGFGWVRAWYPFDSPMTTKTSLLSHKSLDVLKRNMYMARVEFKTDYFRHAMAWIELMEKSEKRKHNNEQNVSENQDTAQQTVAEDIQKSRGKEFSSTAEIYTDKKDECTEKSDSDELTIIEDNKDDEPVTSSSSSNNIMGADVQKQDNIVDFLKEGIQNLLKEIEKMKKEEYRFEFDEIRIVRVSDNNLTDKIGKLRINIDDINCEDSATEELVPAEQKEAAVVTERSKTPKAQEASSSLPEVPDACESQSRGSALNRGVSSPLQEAASRPEDVTPSNSRSSHTKHPSMQQQQKSAYEEAFVRIATNVRSLTQNSTAADTGTLSNERYLTKKSTTLHYPDVTIRPSNSSTNSNRSSNQISVAPVTISSTTNGGFIPQDLFPTVTVFSPAEINERVSSQNFNSAINTKTTIQNVSTPVVITPNVMLPPANNPSSSRHSSPQPWVTPAAINSIATISLGSKHQNSGPIVDSLYKADEINKRVTFQNSSTQMANHSQNIKRQLDIRSNSLRSPPQTSVRSTPQNSPIVDSVYSPDDINKRVTSQNSSTQMVNHSRNITRQPDHRSNSLCSPPQISVRSTLQSSCPILDSVCSPDEINKRVTSQNSSTPIANHSRNITRQPENRSNSLRSPPQISVRSTPQNVCPIVGSVHNPHRTKKRDTVRNFSNPLGFGSVINSRTSPQNSSGPQSNFSRSTERLVGQNILSHLNMDSETNAWNSHQSSSFLAAIASVSKLYVKSSQNSFTPIASQEKSKYSSSHQIHRGSWPGDQTATRKRVHSSITPEPFSQDDYVAEKKPALPRNDTPRNDCSDTNVIILD